MNVYVIMSDQMWPVGVYFRREDAEGHLVGNYHVIEVPLVPTHRHFKGGLYSYVGEGQQTEGIGKSIVYFGTDGQLWLRPPEMFAGRVGDRPRFERL